MLAHRLLRDGDLAFEQELMVSGRRGLRVLYVADFRDDSHSHGWDYSAFVRTYGMYLDERLDCSIGSLAARARPEKRSPHNESRYEYSDSGYYQDEYRSGRDYEDRDRSQRDQPKQPQKSKAVKDIPVPDLLEEFPVFQRVLERVLACRPTGAAKTNRLVQIALYPVVRESFLLYNDIRDGLAILFDAFFDMEQRDCAKVFDMFNRAAKQISELVAYYAFCKALGVCRSSEYPAVEKTSEEMLETMEDFVKNRSDSRRPKSPEPRPRSPPRDPSELAEEEAYEVNGMKALPAPPLKDVPEPETKVTNFPKPVGNDDLINVNDPAISSEEHGDRLALALFSGKESTVTTKWEAFSATEDQGTANSTSTNGAAGWELALVESGSDLSRKPNGNKLAGGFDNLLLDSMYDQAVDRQKFASATAPSGSASSVAMPGRSQSSFLALPAPPVAGQAGTEDPFAASVCVPPPAYVQMSDLKQKQQLLVHEQQQWQQYQQDGMRGYNGLMKFPNNPYFTPFQQNAFTVPYQGYGVNSYYR